MVRDSEVAILSQGLKLFEGKPHIFAVPSKILLTLQKLSQFLKTISKVFEPYCIVSYRKFETAIFVGKLDYTGSLQCKYLTVVLERGTFL